MMEWYNQRDKLLDFAKVLRDLGLLHNIDDLFDYMEKPWKWNAERDLWLEYGSPSFGESNAGAWDAWAAEVDRLR